MNVTSFHIQHVIKAYGQRLGRRDAGRLNSKGSARPAPDIISISTEAKRRQVIDQITHDIVSRAKGRDAQQDSVGNSIFERLGEKLGGPINLIAGEKSNVDFKFRVLSNTEGRSGTIKELSVSDLKNMVENLYSDEINDGE